MRHGLDIARDFNDILEGHARRYTELVSEQIIERRLRTLDLRGQHRLFAYIDVQQQVCIRQACRSAIEAPQGKQRVIECMANGPAESELRNSPDIGPPHNGTPG